MADDVNGAVRAGSDVDVSGAGADVEGGGAGDVEGAVEGAFSGEERGGRKDEREGGCGEAKIHGLPPEWDTRGGGGWFQCSASFPRLRIETWGTQIGCALIQNSQCSVSLPRLKIRRVGHPFD